MPFAAIASDISRAERAPRGQALKQCRDVCYRHAVAQYLDVADDIGLIVTKELGLKRRIAAGLDNQRRYISSIAEGFAIDGGDRSGNSQRVGSPALIRQACDDGIAASFIHEAVTLSVCAVSSDK